MTVFAVGIGVGLYVATMNKTSQSSTSSSGAASDTASTVANTDEPVATKDLSEDQSWTRYSSDENEFSIDLPNGTTFIKGSSQFIYTRSAIVQSDVAATIEAQQGGTDNPYGLFVTYKNFGCNDTERGTKKPDFKTRQAYLVENYHYYQSEQPDGIGIEKGRNEYVYVVKDTSGNCVRVEYHPTDNSNLPYVEEMVKTIKIPSER